MDCYKISCLGPDGSYSALVAQQWEEDPKLVMCADFDEVIDKLMKNDVDCAILPVENSIQGGVLKSLDLLEQFPVFADREYVLSIDHRLAVKVGTKIEEIDCIYSHEQAIGQCAKFLRGNFPKATYIPTASTAESLAKINEHSAGIVGSHVSADGIALSKENIADEKKNLTRFLRIIRKKDALPHVSSKVFFCAVCRHAPGALYDLLSVFASYGINLARIESRPIADRFGDYRFFIEIEADCGRQNTMQALALAEKKCLSFRLIGAY